MAQQTQFGLLSGPSPADLRRRRREGFLNRALQASQGGAGAQVGAGLASLGTALLGGPADTQQINRAEKMQQARQRIQQQLGGVQGILSDETGGLQQAAQNILMEEGVPDAAQRLPLEIAQVRQAMLQPQATQAGINLDRARTAAALQQEPEGIEVKSQFGAQNKDTGERITVLRTNRGLYTQGVDDQGNPMMIPVDSRKIRPIRTQETGTTEELEGLGSTEQRQLRDKEARVRSLIQTTGDAIDLLSKNPDINTFVSKAASITNSLRQEAEALGRSFGLEFDEGVLDPSNYDTQFERMGIQNNRMKSLITSLAFQAAAASGQTGRSVSDRDVQRFMAEIGATTSDPQTFAQVLRDVAERAARRFETDFQVRTNRQFTDDLGLGELPSFSPPEDQSGGGPEQEGQSPDIENLLEKYGQ